MRGLVRLEMSKALKNKWFYAALGIACALAVASAIACVADAEGYLALKRGGIYEWTVRSTKGCFGRSILLAHGGDLWSEVFFLAMPLLVLLPNSCSLRSELVSGQLDQMYVRASRGSYLRAKWLATFAVAATVVVVPIVLNLLVVACFLPGYGIEVIDEMYVCVGGGETWASLLYSAPLAYLTLNVLFDAVLCGCWATLALALSLLVDNRVLLLVGCYLAVIIARYLGSVIFAALGIRGFVFDLACMLRCCMPGNEPRLLPWMTAVLALVFVAGLVVLRARKDGDVL